MNLKLSLFLSAALLLPALCLAADPVETQVVGSKSPAPSVAVRFGDLDLKSPQGARALHERLSTAAWQVCSQMLSRPVSIEGGKCRTQLIEAAVQDINHQQRLAYGADAPILR